jgi:hypothetical protein
VNSVLRLSLAVGPLFCDNCLQTYLCKFVSCVEATSAEERSEFSLEAQPHCVTIVPQGGSTGLEGTDSCQNMDIKIFKYLLKMSLFEYWSSGWLPQPTVNRFVSKYGYQNIQIFDYDYWSCIGGSTSLQKTNSFPNIDIKIFVNNVTV